MLQATIQPNDKKAYWLIGIFSVIVFVAVVFLSQFTLTINPGFDVHIFAKVNAMLNAIVAVLLIAGLLVVRRGNYQLHKRLMYAALILSVLFLVSYICHHLFAGETKYGGVGPIRTVYFSLLLTHIFLAGIILPFILLTAYRGLTSQFDRHRKLAKYTWPLWLYVAVTGPIVYLFISPYYT